ncbi:hypothetical protein LCGC14_0532600 [marine sediment metagenome]|uniref:Uncharacterized protein n=1 Tax=marine sediment metagenome TaxID=412755 RepID=A0A0F9UGR3_9ZZZZ
MSAITDACRRVRELSEQDAISRSDVVYAEGGRAKVYHALAEGKDWCAACTGERAKTMAHIRRAVIKLKLRPCRKCYPSFGGESPPSLFEARRWLEDAAPVLRDLACKALLMLEELGWNGAPVAGQARCDFCGNGQREGHDQDCELGRFLRRAAKELGA